MFPSSIFTLMLIISWMTSWNFVNYSIMDLSSTIENEYSYYFRHTLWAKYLVIYNDTSFTHIKGAVFFLATSLKNSSPRNIKLMVLLALPTVSFFSVYVRSLCINALTFDASTQLSWVNISWIFTFHSPILLLSIFQYYNAHL